MECFGVSLSASRINFNPRSREGSDSVKHCKELTLSLNIAALILMVADMITFFLLGYYDEFLHLFF